MPDTPETVLKPCPHGKKALVLNIGGGDAPFSIVVRPEHRCVNREIGWYASRNEAIAAWNALLRTPSSATPEVSELFARLRSTRSCREVGTIGNGLCYVDTERQTLINPDGPEAATALKTLEARVKVLEEAGRLALLLLECAEFADTCGIDESEVCRQLRAALLKQLSGDDE